MNLLRSIQKTLATVALLFSTSATACWYQSLNYNDYIATVNGISVHESRVEVDQGVQSNIQRIRYSI